MSKEELKPCPFCGGANLSIVPYGLERDDEQPADRSHAVSCEDCGSLGAEIAPHSAAVAAWNRRAQPAEAEEALMKWKQTAEYWYGQYRFVKHGESPEQYPAEGKLDDWHNSYHNP